MKKRWLLLFFPVALVTLLAACQPTLDEDLSHVDGPRILAIASEPPEVAPGSAATLHALYTDGATAPLSAPLTWDLCVVRPALASPTELSSACLTAAPGALQFLGTGLTAQGTVPADVCGTFGPDQPMTMTAGQSAGRPFDPDATGGYYLPGIVHAAAADDAQFSVRIQCGLAGATQADAATFQRTYLPNTNPTLADVTITHADGTSAAAADGAEISAAANEVLGVSASWPDCPDPTRSCAGAETFPFFDPSARVLVPQREALTVSWLGTHGHFADVRSGRDGTDLAEAVATTWTAPSSGDALLWFVLRDSRGGTSFRSVHVTVH